MGDVTLATWLIGAAATGVLGVVTWAAKRVVSDVKEVGEGVKAATAKLIQHDAAIAELQRAQGRLEKENEAQWGRINGGLENHGNRITKLEVQMATILERRS